MKRWKIPGSLYFTVLCFYNPFLMQNKHLASLQVLRGIAACSVVFFHGTQIIERYFSYTFLNEFFLAGFSGVDIFFVLSGFIIFYSSARKNKVVGIQEFATKRAIRVYPVYWVVSILLLVAYNILPNAAQSHKGDWQVILGSFMLWPQERYIVDVAWTLSYEIIFYMFFGLIYLRSAKAFYYFASLWSIIIIGINFVVGYQPANHFEKTILNPVIVEFFLGCLIAVLYREYPQKYWKLILGIGLLLFSFSWIYIWQTGDLLISRLLFFGVPSTLIIYGTLYIDWKVQKILSYLGDASYSIYLVHGTLMAISSAVLSQLGFAPYLGNFFGAMLIFILGTVGGCVFHSMVERPLLAYLKVLFIKPVHQKI